MSNIAWAAYATHGRSGPFILETSVSRTRGEVHRKVGEFWAKDGEPAAPNGWKRAYKRGWRAIKIKLIPLEQDDDDRQIRAGLDACIKFLEEHRRKRVEDIMTLGQMAGKLEVERDALAAHVALLRNALEIIAGRKQCLDNLMGNQDVAEAALNATPAASSVERDERVRREALAMLPKVPTLAISNSLTILERLCNRYGFQCEAGPLDKCIEVVALKKCLLEINKYSAAIGSLMEQEQDDD